MPDYYRDTLSAERLRRCYDLAPPRVSQYLDAEIEFVLGRIARDDLVLELGCGYGRALPALAARARLVVGIDTSMPSLRYGRRFLGGSPNCLLVRMDAMRPAFFDMTFDCVVCIQNGISAFHADQRELVRRSVRLAKRGGAILFSSYSEKFWPHRLEWFRRQAEAGLIGEIDEGRTGNGVIVCRDGFTASTMDRDRFLELAAGLDIRANVVEVDGSSVFCELVRRQV